MNRGLITVVVIGSIVAFTIYKMPSEDKGTSSSTQQSDPTMQELPRVGYKAPQFSLPALDGKTYSLAQMNGKPIVINFWASWCTPCKTEAPELVAIYDKYKDKVEIYGINVTAADTLDDAKAFVNEYGFKFPVLIDGQAEASKKYGIKPIPTTFFINGEGIIIDKYIGLLDQELMESKFNQLLQNG